MPTEEKIRGRRLQSRRRLDLSVDPAAQALAFAATDVHLQLSLAGINVLTAEGNVGLRVSPRRHRGRGRSEFHFQLDTHAWVLARRGREPSARSQHDAPTGQQSRWAYAVGRARRRAIAAVLRALAFDAKITSQLLTLDGEFRLTVGGVLFRGRRARRRHERPRGGQPTIFSLDDAGGALRITPDGLAASVGFLLDAPPIAAADFSFGADATFLLEINTTGQNITLPGRPQLFAGPTSTSPPQDYARLAVAGDITSSGFKLAGVFQVTATAIFLQVAALGVTSQLVVNGATLLDLRQGNAAHTYITPTTFAAYVSFAQFTGPSAFGFSLWGKTSRCSSTPARR